MGLFRSCYGLKALVLQAIRVSSFGMQGEPSAFRGFADISSGEVGVLPTSVLLYLYI